MEEQEREAGLVGLRLFAFLIGAIVGIVAIVPIVFSFLVNNVMRVGVIRKNKKKKGD